jgi:hypothetical protein
MLRERRRDDLLQNVDETEHPLTDGSALYDFILVVLVLRLDEKDNDFLNRYDHSYR